MYGSLCLCEYAYSFVVYVRRWSGTLGSICMFTDERYSLGFIGETEGHRVVLASVFFCCDLLPLE